MTVDFVMDQRLQLELSVSAQQSHMVDADWFVKSNAYLCVKSIMLYMQHVTAPK